MDSVRHLAAEREDFPKQGVTFLDVSSVLMDGATFNNVVDAYVGQIRDLEPTHIAGLEARGFIFGGAVAAILGTGFLPARKSGKLPFVAATEPYASEYGMEWFQIPSSLPMQGAEVVIVDDVLATGGSILAVDRLCRSVGARVTAAVVLWDIPGAGGREALDAQGILLTVLDPATRPV